jgi:hypothetical protein
MSRMREAILKRQFNEFKDKFYKKLLWKTTIYILRLDKIPRVSNTIEIWY